MDRTADAWLQYMAWVTRNWGSYWFRFACIIWTLVIAGTLLFVFAHTAVALLTWFFNQAPWVIWAVLVLCAVAFVAGRVKPE